MRRLGKWETTCNQENGWWWTSIQSARSSFPGPPFTHQRRPPPPAAPSSFRHHQSYPRRTYTCKNLFLIFRSSEWREINIRRRRGFVRGWWFQPASCLIGCCVQTAEGQTRIISGPQRKHHSWARSGQEGDHARWPRRSGFKRKSRICQGIKN